MLLQLHNTLTYTAHVMYVCGIMCMYVPHTIDRPGSTSTEDSNNGNINSGRTLNDNNDNNTSVQIIERAFHIAAIWAFGGHISNSNNKDCEIFNKEWRTRILATLINSTVLQIPDTDSIFDYHIDVVTGTVTPWRAYAAPRNCCSSNSRNATSAVAITIVIPTVGYKSITYMLETVTRAGQHILLTGPYGSGKSLVIQNHLQRLSEDNTAIQTVNIHLDYYSNAQQLQSQFEGQDILIKKSGHSYGPANNINKLIYFIEDLNLPDSTSDYSIGSTDSSCTGSSGGSSNGIIHDTSPAALVRQWMNYNGW
jgi:hypothetical protein